MYCLLEWAARDGDLDGELLDPRSMSVSDQDTRIGRLYPADL
jgi:hypothetical protein